MTVRNEASTPDPYMKIERAEYDFLNQRAEWLVELVAAVEAERKWATGTFQHTVARSALYGLAEAIADALSEGPER